MSLGGIGQNEVILSNSALQLGLEVISVIRVAVVSDPHLRHPFNVVLDHVALGKGAVPYVRVLPCQAALALQLEVKLAILHVIAH
jgi:hypothetical protein